MKKAVVSFVTSVKDRMEKTISVFTEKLSNPPSYKIPLHFPFYF